MNYNFRLRAGALGLAAGMSLGLINSASAQSYPEKPVRMIVAFGSGGTLDTLARIISEKLSEKWGQSVIVDNRPGAGGNIGATAAAKAAPDGYTLHFGAQALAVNVTLAPTPTFDPVKDFDPVMLVATAQDVLMVGPNSPFKSVQDLVDAAKAHPGELTYSSSGVGSSGHLATVLLSDLTGIKLEHIPYTSLGQSVADLMGGRTSMWIATLGGHLGNIKTGKVRALAVSGETRAAELPDVPTFKELGVPFVAETSWYGIFAPKGTPKEITAKINADVAQIIELPDVKAKIAPLGFRMIGGPPEKLGELLQSEIAKWAKLAKTASLASQ